MPFPPIPCRLVPCLFHTLLPFSLDGSPWIYCVIFIPLSRRVCLSASCQRSLPAPSTASHISLIVSSIRIHCAFVWCSIRIQSKAGDFRYMDRNKSLLLQFVVTTR